jgi:hypothetical protein
MKQHAMMVVLSTGLLFLTDVMAQSSPATVATVHASPDARRLRTGHFTYRILDHGKNVGTGTITIQKIPNSGNYAFAAEFSGYADQKWESIATSAFEPVSATLSLGKATSSTPAFALKYTGRRVTGFAISRKKPDLGTRRSIDAALPANTVDQRIDWAAVLASHLETGQQFEFNVYDPGTGISRVVAQVGSLERVQVPAGTFDAYRVIYRIEKAGETEQYQVLASRDRPRVMVREEFSNGTASDLIEVK